MLTKIHHAGVVVRSADSALGFYRDILGLPVTKDEVIADQGVRGVLLAAGEGEIELLEPTRSDTGVARFLESRGEGIHHLCFATNDINAELTAARNKGLQLIDQQPRPGLAGMIAFLHPRATRGVLVEYAQPPAGQASATHLTDGAGVQELDHVVVATSDLDATTALWSANFGLAESRRGEAPTLGIRQALLPIGKAFIEVVTPLAAEGAVARFLAERGEAIYLVSLAVPDLDRAVAGLRGQQVRVSDPVAAGSGSRLSFISASAAHGVLVQLIERRGGAT